MLHSYPFLLKKAYIALVDFPEIIAEYCFANFGLSFRMETGCVAKDPTNDIPIQC